MVVHNPLDLSADKLVLACTHEAMELNYLLQDNLLNSDL